MREVFEVDGLFDGSRTMTNAAIVVEGTEVVWVGQRNAIPKTPQGQRSETVRSPGSFVLPGMITCHRHGRGTREGPRVIGLRRPRPRLQGRPVADGPDEVRKPVYVRGVAAL